MRQPSQRETKVFEALCGPVTAADLAALRAAVQRHKRDLDQASRESEFLATDLAEELADKLDDLLETLPSLPEDVRPLVAGAARYHYCDTCPAFPPAQPPVRRGPLLELGQLGVQSVRREISPKTSNVTSAPTG